VSLAWMVGMPTTSAAAMAVARQIMGDFLE